MSQLVEQLVADHLRAWNSPASAEREALVADTYTPEVYVGEPDKALTGHAGVTSAIDALQRQVSGGELTRVGKIIQVQDLVTYTWQLAIPGPGVVATGSDILIVGAGKIQRLYVVIDG